LRKTNKKLNLKRKRRGGGGMKAVKVLALIIAILFLIPFTTQADMNDFYNALSGMQAIKDAANGQPVMLNPEIKQKLKKIYIEIKNTSPVSGLSTEPIKAKVVEGLKAKGYEIVENPDTAEYLVTVDINKLTIVKEKKVSLFGSILGGVGSTVLGVAGAVAGAATGNMHLPQIAAEVGSSVGSVVGEAVGDKLDEALVGCNYAYAGTLVVAVIEKYNEDTKTYNGKYPLFGESKQIKGTITEDISEKVSKVLVEIF
jgi:hypothetical protein